MAAKLSNVTFHNKLGTQAERIGRIADLAEKIAPIVGADAAEARLAAEVAKGDLSSEMVYEFPELQGIMGKYYAERAGMSQAVANACQDHYSPLGPSDDVPTEPVSVSVALADKIDTLTGFWGIDEKPTGSKDPFALRRAALGVIRLILENNVRVNLSRFVDLQLLKSQILQNGEAADAQSLSALQDMLEEIEDHGVFGAAFHTVMDKIKGEDGKEDLSDDPLIARVRDSLPATSGSLLAFFHDRLKVVLRDQGISHDVIDACLALPNNDDFVLLTNRATALRAFLHTDDGTNLLQGFKRANNILSAEEKKDGVHYELEPDVKYAEDDAERALFSALDQAEHAIKPTVQAEDFAAAMTAMSALRAPIDAFFEAVQVNAEKELVRRNRLCLLNRIREVMGQVAKFSDIEG
jgi:glycyl-tRNA synthetase beta chain